MPMDRSGFRRGRAGARRIPACEGSLAKAGSFAAALETVGQQFLEHGCETWAKAFETEDGGVYDRANDATALASFSPTSNTV